ncbi:hypothetical protein [Thauera humireducens]|uniref:hypothetical protein n=1 Tax=Thauera humireducens TaxID=1134435 RepID=UPI00311E3BCC
MIDPQELYLFGQPVHFGPLATYSIGFLGFWLVCAASSLSTIFSSARFRRAQSAALMSTKAKRPARAVLLFMVPVQR